MIVQYLKIIKPGIIFGNFISVVGGFLLASKGQIDYYLFFNTSIGVALIVASACVFNNYIDRDIDQKMDRTKNRILVKRLISLKTSLIYATILGITGLTFLYQVPNRLVMWLAVMGFVIYVIIYSLYMKRKSIYSTIVGSLSGATPPVIGYCAVNNQFDIGAFILLLIFSLWQMPHAYAIAILRFKDYQMASIPVLPVKMGVSVTKHHIILYIIGYMLATMLLTFNGYVGYKYFIVSVAMNILWLSIAIQGYKSFNNDEIWAKKLFIVSIIAITSLSIMMSLDVIVPYVNNQPVYIC